MGGTPLPIKGLSPPPSRPVTPKQIYYYPVFSFDPFGIFFNIVVQTGAFSICYSYRVSYPVKPYKKNWQKMAIFEIWSKVRHGPPLKFKIHQPVILLCFLMIFDPDSFKPGFNWRKRLTLAIFGHLGEGDVWGFMTCNEIRRRQPKMLLWMAPLRITIQRCLNSVSKVFKGRYKGVSRKYQACFKGALR